MGVANGTKPQRTDVAAWIGKSWNAITGQAITNTWRKVGLPKLDESEDDSDNNSNEEDCLDFEAMGIAEDNDTSEESEDATGTGTTVAV